MKKSPKLLQLILINECININKIAKTEIEKNIFANWTK